MTWTISRNMIFCPSHGPISYRDFHTLGVESTRWQNCPGSSIACNAEPISPKVILLYIVLIVYIFCLSLNRLWEVGSDANPEAIRRSRQSFFASSIAFLNFSMSPALTLRAAKRNRSSSNSLSPSKKGRLVPHWSWRSPATSFLEPGGNPATIWPHSDESVS